MSDDGNSRRMKRWRRCRWPHRIMTSAEDEELRAFIRSLGPFIKRCATLLSSNDPWMRLELRQAAIILLWRWGPARIAERGDAAVCGAIVRAMKAARRIERRVLTDAGLVWRRS
jgi:hypothetical protein